MNIKTFHRYGDDEQSSANISELEYYKRDFNLIYSADRTTESDTMSEIKTLVEWVAVAGQDLFRDTIDEHFNREYLFRYLLCVLFVAGVDSLGKNLKLTTYDGKIFYPTFYDLDWHSSPSKTFPNWLGSLEIGNKGEDFKWKINYKITLND